MSQVTNYAVPNGPRADVRQGINAVLAALRDANAGATEPPNPVPHMLWLDTSGADVAVKIRNAANTGWRFLDEVIGMSAVGLAIANAADADAARSLLGATATGSSIFTASDAPAVRTLLSLAIYAQTTAEAGTSNTTGLMSPVRAAQLITARHANSAVIATNGAAAYDVTAIPSWARRITVMLNGVKTANSDFKFIQLGDAGGIETTGYNAGAANGTAVGEYVTASAYLPFSPGNNAAAEHEVYGSLMLTLQDPATNLWVMQGSTYCSPYGVGSSSAGAKALSAPLDRIRLGNSLNANFTGGSMALRWEV